MASGPRICGGGKRYCVLCTHHQGQVLDDGVTTIKLHGLPADPPKEKADERSRLKREQRRIWVSRIKLARPNAPISSSTRICNLHFEGHRCVIKFHSPRSVQH